MKWKNQRWADIQSVMAKVDPLVMELTSRRTPQDGLQGKFSVFYGCAVGFIYKAGPLQQAGTMVTNPSVVALRDKVDATPDISLAADETMVGVALKDDSKLNKPIRARCGELEEHMTGAQLQAEFVDQCVRMLWADGANAVSERCWRLGETQDVSEIPRLL